MKFLAEIEFSADIEEDEMSFDEKVEFAEFVLEAGGDSTYTTVRLKVIKELEEE